MVESLRETLFETAAGADEELMEKYFEDMMLSEEDTVKGLRQGLKDRSVFPVLCGAADSGIGTEAVLQAIVDYVPNPAEVGEARSCSRPFPTSSASTPSSRCSPARSRPICLCATCA